MERALIRLCGWLATLGVLWIVASVAEEVTDLNPPLTWIVVVGVWACIRPDIARLVFPASVWPYLSQTT